jgi:hypothetical protein
MTCGFDCSRFVSAYFCRETAPETQFVRRDAVTNFGRVLFGWWMVVLGKVFFPPTHSVINNRSPLMSNNPGAIVVSGGSAFDSSIAYRESSSGDNDSDLSAVTTD